jgi:hypothetical protein
MKAIGAPALKGFFVSVFLVFLPGLLAAQVTIKERVEINPITKIVAAVNPGNLYCFGEGLKIMRPCKIVGTGYLSNDPPNTVWLSMGAAGGLNITNTTDSVVVGCQGFGIGLYSAWCTVFLDEYREVITGNDARVEFNGHCFSTPFSGHVELHATPLYDDPHFTIWATPTTIDAYIDTFATIGSQVADNAGNAFCCCEPMTVFFTIENPMPYIYLREIGDPGKRGDTLSEPAGFAWGKAYAFLFCDRQNLPDGDIDVMARVRAEIFGLSVMQEVQIKRILPHHFSIEAEREPYATESVPIHVIARDESNREIDLDPGVSITLSAEAGGSFIIGTDTIDDGAEVAYGDARRGAVRCGEIS